MKIEGQFQAWGRGIRALPSLPREHMPPLSLPLSITRLVLPGFKSKKEPITYTSHSSSHRGIQSLESLFLQPMPKFPPAVLINSSPPRCSETVSPPTEHLLLRAPCSIDMPFKYLQVHLSPQGPSSQGHPRCTRQNPHFLCSNAGPQLRSLLVNSLAQLPPPALS